MSQPFPSPETVKSEGTAGVLGAFSRSDPDTAWLYDPDNHAVYEVLAEPAEVHKRHFAVAVKDEAGCVVIRSFHDSDEDRYPVLTENEQTDVSDNSEITLEPGTKVYGTDAVEVGINPADRGYIKLETVFGNGYEFTVSKEAVVQFVTDKAKDEPPAPTRPEGVIENVDVPDGWNEAVGHTGGGIWCRIFSKDQSNGSRIEVVYNVRHHDGVSAGLYGPGGEWLGEIVAEDRNGTREDALEGAYDLINEIDGGEHDERIDELAEGQ